MAFKCPCWLCLLFGICLILLQSATAAQFANQQHHLKDTDASFDPDLAATTYPHISRKRSECKKQKYRKSMLKLIKEMPFIGLFEDVKGETKFEASGMTVAPYTDPQFAPREWLWIVFDNLHALGRIDEHFEFRAKKNRLLGTMELDSQFEGLTYVESTGHFIALEEVTTTEHGMHAVAHELAISADGSTYNTLQECPIHFQLVHENKGFEGIHYHESDKGHYLLGLCEGNYCVGSDKGKEAGNGRIVVTVSNGQRGKNCGWDVVKVVNIPRTAYFTDYSGMAFRGNRLAIVSQENATMWIGSFDFDTLEFTDQGKVYNFPRDSHCDIKYCNVEGVQWLDDVRFVVASDKAKRYQPFRCLAKEQRVSIFALPDNLD